MEESFQMLVCVCVCTVMLGGGGGFARHFRRGVEVWQSNLRCQVCTVPCGACKETGLQNAVNHKEFVVSLFSLPFM